MPPETLDALNKDELKPLLLKLFAQNGQLLERIDDLLATNKALLARVAELEAKQGQPPKTPTNSSLPPSKGQKSNVALPSGAKKRRKGRRGVARELCPTPDETRNIYADRCACGTAVSATE
jgi:transposase